MTGIRPSLIAASRRRFNPLSLSPALWLSDTGNDPGIWPDLSGNERHATQSTPANQPAIITNALNGRQVRRFDGTDFMQVAHAADLNIQYNGSVFCVIKKSAGFRIMQKKSGSAGVTSDSWFFNDGSNLSAAGCFTTSYAPNENTATILSGVFGTRIAHWKNGAKQTPTNVMNGTIVSGELLPSLTPEANTDPLEIGRRDFTTTGIITGDIADILVFPTALSTADRQRVESFFSQKYNIALA